MSTDIAVRSNGSAVARRVEAFVPSTLSDYERLGGLLAASGYFKDVRDQAQAIAKILAGAELGVPPMAALMGVFFYDGKPSIGANLAAGVIRGSGVYDYRILEETADRCVLAVYRGGKEIGQSSFTREEAQQAGLLGKDNWRKYPKDMLFARAITRAARRHCPDLFGGLGVYTADELGQETDADGNPLKPPPAPTVRVIQGEVVDTETGEITPPAKRWSQAQLNRFWAQLQPLKPKVTGEEVHAVLGTAAGRVIESIHEWTGDLDDAVRLVFEARQRATVAEPNDESDGEPWGGGAGAQGAEHPAGSIEAAWQRYRAARASAELWNGNNPSAQVKIAPPPPENEATAVQVEAYAKQLESAVAKALQPFAAGGGK